MKCEICGGHEFDGRDVDVSCIPSLAERVAKLEAERAVPLTIPTVHHSTNVRVAVTAEPTAPAIPDGFALAPGVPWWSVGGDTPWPLRAILERLAKSTSHLLNAHGCDCDQWETTAAARDAALSLLALVPAEPSGTRGELHHCSHDGCARNGARCGSDDRWWCDPHWNGTAEPSGTPCIDMARLDSLANEGRELGREVQRRAARMTAPAPQPEAPEGCMKCRNGIDRQGRACRYCSWKAEPLPAEPPKCGGGRTDCFCAARDEKSSVWCRRCADAWCCADEDDPNAECRVEPPAERPAPEVAKRGRTEARRETWCANGAHGSEPHIDNGECLPSPSEPAKAPLSRVIEALRTVEGPDYAEGFAAGVAESNAKVADLEARLAQADLFLAVKDKVLTGFEKRITEQDAKLARAERRQRAAELERDDLRSKLAAAEKCKECGGTNGVDPFCDDCYCRDVDARVAEERARCLWFARNVHDVRHVGDAIASGTPAPTVTP